MWCVAISVASRLAPLLTTLSHGLKCYKLPYVSKIPLGSGLRGVAPAAPVDLEHSEALLSSRLMERKCSGVLVRAPERGTMCSISSYAIQSKAILWSALEHSLDKGGFC